MIRICAGTDPGLARRNNEDSIAFDVETGLCVLADGMGGHNAGEIASGMATAFIKSELRQWLSQAGKDINAADVETAMLQCVTQANHAIHNMSAANHQYAGMGTTLVVGVFHDDSLTLGHIGDSRGYRLRDGQLLQITKDHSILQEQFDTGLAMSLGKLSAMGRNLVTRALGVNKEVLIDIHQHDVMPGDVYLMCSDGLSDMLDEEAMTAILLRADTLEEKVRLLIAAANKSGGRDNISVVLACAGKTGLLSSAQRALHGAWSGLRR